MAVFGFPLSPCPFYFFCDLQPVEKPEAQFFIVYDHDFLDQIAKQLLIEGVQPVRPAFKNIQHVLCLLDGMILLRPQDAFLLELQFPAALRKQIAAGYKNVRIDAALLLELGQKSFLTGNIRY